MKKIKLYWWRGEGATDSSKRNFGDYLSPMIVEMLSGKEVIHSHPKHADMLAIGTILPVEKKAKGLIFKRRLHIWGSGTDRCNRQFSDRHHYHAVRGALSRNQIEGDKGDIYLGDPGLLADRLVKSNSVPKKYEVGVIAHYVDQSDPRLPALLSKKNVKKINVFDPVDQVLQQIQECDIIISSSMHGLIVADSFGIPNRRLVLSQGLISDYKFGDYYSAFGINEPPPLSPESVINNGFTSYSVSEGYARPRLEEIKAALEKAFPTSL